MKKTKIYIIILMVGVGLIVGSLISKKGESTDIVGDKADTMRDVKIESTDASSMMGGQQSLEGILRSSNDPSRGNFKLVSYDREVYIKTSRDFSKLVGLQVLVLINGTLDNFQLLDIQPAVQKDGFIISQ